MKAISQISNNYFYKDPKCMSLEEIDRFINKKTKVKKLTHTNSCIFKKKKSNESVNSSFNTEKNQKQNKENYNKKTLDLKRSNSGPKKRNSFNEIQSKMSNDYIKILQEQIYLLQKENKNLKTNFIKINELLNSERNSKRINDTNLNINKENIRNEEIEKLKQQNDYLIKENNILKTQMNKYNKEDNKIIEELNNKINEYKIIIKKQKEEIKALQSDILIFNEKYENEKRKEEKYCIKTSASNYEEEKQSSVSERNSKKKIKIKSNYNNNFNGFNISFSNNLNTSIQKSSSTISNNKTMKSRKKKDNFIPISNLSTLRLKSSKKKKIKVNKSLSKEKSEDEIKNNIKKEVMETPNKFNYFENVGRNNKINEEIERTPQFKTFKEESSTREKNFIHDFNNELESINLQIPIIESNIEQLKYNYNILLNKLDCCQNSDEVNQIRGNLKLISVNLEEKTFQLFTLKTQQQKILKTYLE